MTKKKANAKVARKKKVTKSPEGNSKKGEKSMETQTQTQEDANPFAEGAALQEVTSENIEVVGEAIANEKKESDLIIPDDLKGVNLKDRVSELKGQIDNASFELGRVIYYINVNQEYLEWGYDTLDKYLDAEEPGGRSRLRGLMSLHKWFEEEIKDPKKIASIQNLGWTKAIQVKRGMELEATESNQEEVFKKWTEMGNESSSRALTKAVDNTKKSLDEKSAEDAENNPDHTKPVERDERTPISFSLYAEQYKTVMDALGLAQKVSGSEIKSNNLSLICQEYLMSTEAGKDYKEARMKWLPRLEEQLRGKIVFLDSETEEVIYGQELLDGDGEEEE